MRRLFAAFLLAAALATPALAQPADDILMPAASANVDPRLRARAAELVGVLRGNGREEAVFSPQFLAEIPLPQIRSIGQSLRAQHGALLGVEAITPESPLSGTLALRYERAVVMAEVKLIPGPPFGINYLLLTGVNPRDDNVEKLVREFAALPGQAGFAVARIDGDRPLIMASHQPDRQFAIGSTFKLYVLAELAAQIDAGQRRWSDVVPLNTRSFPTGILQSWPQNSPVTLSTLATLMISMSDNTATDVLIGVLGRENVERRLARIGHGDPERTLPFLTTIEAFALKMPANDDLRTRYVRASEAGQRALLQREAGSLGLDAIHMAELDGGPLHIDTAEWFASPRDLVALIDAIDRLRGREASAIMAVNPGLTKVDAGKWAYLGYKGGSEPGVMNMTFLAVAHDGRRFAITGSWNNPDSPVDEARMAMLMSRLVALTADKAR